MNARSPAPVSTIARTALSRSATSTAKLSSLTIALSNAFSRAGRSIVSTSTPASRSSSARMYSLIANSPRLGAAPAAPLVGPRQPEHRLRDVREDHLLGDGRETEQPDVAP